MTYQEFQQQAELIEDYKSFKVFLYNNGYVYVYLIDGIEVSYRGNVTINDFQKYSNINNS